MRGRVTFLGCLALSAGAAPAQDRSMPDTRPPRAEVIARLDSPVFDAREQASYDLLTREGFTIDEAELELSRPGLTAEQRLRLEWVALQVFRRGPRAAMGIQFMPERDGVRVEDVLVGFPAAAVLLPGDQIVEADGRPVSEQAGFRAAILSHAPEETMRLTIDRNGARMQVTVTLGSLESLVGAVGPRESDILAAWNLRRMRDGALAHPEPLRPEPAPGGSAGMPERGSPAWNRVYATADAPGGIVIGGQARDTADLSLTQLNAIDASRTLTLDALENVGRADLAVQLGLLRGRRELILEDMDRVNRLIEGPNLDAGGRAMMRRRYEELRGSLGVLEEQIRLLDQARRGEGP